MYAVFFSLCKCARHCHFLYFCELMFLSDSHVVGQTDMRDMSRGTTCFCVTVTSLDFMIL